ncbi:opacity family porin [Neisseria sp.]|uniref:opacity family porin n=1 Tax=Neisseria sp. TaxID=192066 RepID=UPI00359F49CD
MMKHILAAAVLALSASAFADTGVYVQGDVGAARVKLKGDEGGSLSKSGFSPRVTVGYDFGNNIRAGVDYTHYKPFKASYRDADEQVSEKVKFQSVGVSAVYDFPVHERIKPYVGARLGINRVSQDVSETNPNGSFSGSYRKTKTGIGALAGVGFDLTDKITLDAGYRYNHWGKFDGVKINSHEASVGIRAKF